MDKKTWFKMAAENLERVTRATSDRSWIEAKRVRTEASCQRTFFRQRVVISKNRLPAETRDAKNVKILSVN